MNADDVLRQLDNAIYQVVNALDAIKNDPDVNPHLKSAISEFFEESWDHVRLIVALKEEATRVDWVEPTS